MQMHHKAHARALALVIMGLCGGVQDTSLNLLFAGHDTSAAAITLAVRDLKLQPHLLHKLRQEQQQVRQPFWVLEVINNMIGV